MVVSKGKSMKNPKIKTRVVHSQTKAAWNVVGEGLGGKFKVARIPYVTCIDEKIDALNRLEALDHAEFISYCFNNSDRIFEAFNLTDTKTN